MSLTPYDTGERAEPYVWVPDEGDPDSYGRVDFENDESAMIVGAHVERTGNGNYRLVVDDWTGDLEVVMTRE